MTDPESTPDRSEPPPAVAGSPGSPSDPDDDHAGSSAVEAALLHPALQDLAAVDRHGHTELMIAANQGDLDTVQRLLDAGANPAQCSNFGQTALMFAVPHAGVVRVLLQAIESCGLTAAAIDLQDYSGETALMKTVKQLAEAQRPDAVSGKDSVQLLLEAGAHPNLQRADGSTALLMAASTPEGDELVLRLLEAGSNARLTHTSGITPLMAAVGHGLKHCIPALIKLSEINARTQSGHSALFSAAVLEDSNFVRLLLDARADPSVQEYTLGMTPLLSACAAGRSAAAKFIIMATADIEAVESSEGNSPLIEAAKNGLPDVVAELTTHLARVDWTNKRGESALDLCLRTGDVESTRCLLEAGCSVAQTSPQQQLPQLPHPHHQQQQQQQQLAELPLLADFSAESQRLKRKQFLELHCQQVQTSTGLPRVLASMVLHSLTSEFRIAGY